MSGIGINNRQAVRSTFYCFNAFFVTFPFGIATKIIIIILAVLIDKNRADISLVVNVPKQTVVQQPVKTVHIVQIILIFFKTSPRPFYIKKRTVFIHHAKHCFTQTKNLGNKTEVFN